MVLNGYTSIMKKEIIFLLIVVLGVGLICGCTTTPQPPSTAEPTSAIKTVLFSDDLSRWRSEWDSEIVDDEGKTFYSGGSLHILDKKPPTGTNYHTLNKNFNDFILDLDTRLIAGTDNNYQGVVIRMQDEENHYFFVVSADGYYDILKWENDNRIDLIGSNVPRSSYINTGIGATNHIQVEANKNTLSFSVNGHHLRTVTDNTFREGTVALVANSLTSDSFTEVAFSNLVITTI